MNSRLADQGKGVTPLRLFYACPWLPACRDWLLVQADEFQALSIPRPAGQMSANVTQLNNCPVHSSSGGLLSAGGSAAQPLHPVDILLRGGCVTKVSSTKTSPLKSRLSATRQQRLMTFDCVIRPIVIRSRGTVRAEYTQRERWRGG